MNIKYRENVTGLSADQLEGFFRGWPGHPDAERHLEILRGSHRVCLAMDGERCVGFINAISDGNFSAFIPLLEVLPEYQGQGIGSELVRRLLADLEHVYSIDIACDEDVVPFYQAQGLSRLVCMAKRNYANQVVSPRA